MKKFIVACLMCLITVLSFGQEDMVLHVYRNDSVFNAFYTFEIDSMCCSVVDTMGIEHDGYVVQEIYTADSLYRIPLNAIDSIVFATPKIEYHQDVRVITDSWLDYVVSINELTIILSQDIPSDVIPAKGDVLVAETESAPFERGFAGRVSDVEKREDSIVVICDDVTLNDIYKTLIYKGTSKSSTDILQGKKQQRAENRNEMGTLYFDIPNNLSLNLGPMSLNISPTIMLDYVICINDNQTYLDNRIKHYYDCSAQLDCELTEGYSPEPDFIFSFDIPTKIPGLYVEVNMGSFFESSGGVIISMNQPFIVTGTTGYVAYDDCVADIDEWHLERKEIEFSVNLNGSIRFGLATQAKLAFMSDRLASIDVTAYLGPEIQSNLSLSSEGLLDGSLYTALKESVVTLSLYGSIIPGWRFYGFEHQKFNYNPSFHFSLNTWYILPEFNNLSWMPSEGTKGGKLSGGINRDLFWPGIQLGWSLYDENDQIYSSQYYPETYRLMREWPYDGMDMNLQELPYGSKYKAYPMIKIFGYEMRALPSVDVSIDPLVETGNAFDIQETSVMVSGRVEGMGYSMVADAGICYSIGDAILGKYISSNNKNDGSFDIFLSGLEDNTTYYYCAYANCDGVYYYGEVCSFKTLEKVETKAVDLGLSVKWATCNVGATTPEEYGYYFAWGEVEPKTTYDWSTYKYCVDGYDNLTKYCSKSSYGNNGFTDTKTVLDPKDDVATANWGGEWRMPTRAELDELLKNCTWTWTTQNGVNGYKVTGPNGNSIFLPAAGVMGEGSLLSAGSSGHFWSSSLYTENPYNAYHVGFYSDFVGWYNYSRYHGRSVRPVCK